MVGMVGGTDPTAFRGRLRSAPAAAEAWRLRRLGVPEEQILCTQSNLANTYNALGRSVDALRIRGDVYSGLVRLLGKESKETLITANCYASTLIDLQRHAEAKALLRNTLPVARDALGKEKEEHTNWRSKPSYRWRHPY